MTMPYQRALALEGGYELIQKVIADPSASTELKELAKWAKRHYPTPREIQAEARVQMAPGPLNLRGITGPWLAPRD